MKTTTQTCGISGLKMKLNKGLKKNSLSRSKLFYFTLLCMFRGWPFNLCSTQTANVSQERTLLALSIRLTWAECNRSTPGSVCLTCSRCRASKFIASVTAEGSYAAISQSAAWHSTANGCTNGWAVYNCRKQSTNTFPAPTLSPLKGPSKIFSKKSSYL